MNIVKETKCMITIRAYDNDEEKEKLLETHVFDFGEKEYYKTPRKHK